MLLALCRLLRSIPNGCRVCLQSILSCFEGVRWVLLLKIEIISQKSAATHLTRSKLSKALLRAKEGQILHNPVFELWVAAGGSVTPPMHSNVFVGVFGMRSEFIRAPLVPSALEIKE